MLRGVFGLKGNASTLKQLGGLLLHLVEYIHPFCFVCVEVGCAAAVAFNVEGWIGSDEVYGVTVHAA